VDDPITWESLATVSGASGASAMLVGFVRIFVKNMSAQVTRMLAAIFGVLIVEGAVLALGAAGVLEIILALFSGVAAGLAASKAVEVSQNGLNHDVTPRA
jgi:hypothetical protein